MSDFTSVTIAPVEACNLSCAYCRPEAPRSGQGAGSALLSVRTAAAFLRWVVDTGRSRWISVYFHGGEPTLAPVSWYDELLGGAAALAANRAITFQWHLQTNGQLIDESWVDLARRYDLKFGISVDGPPELSAPYRPGAARAAAAIRFLGDRGIFVGSIVVGTTRNLPQIRRVHEYLGGLGVRTFHVNPLLPMGKAKGLPTLSPRMLVDAYAALVESSLERPHLPLEGRLMEYVARFLAPGTGHLKTTGCFSGVKPCGTRSVYLDSRGGVFPCARAADPALRFGVADEDGVRLEPAAAKLPNAAPG